MNDYPILNKVNSSNDIKKLNNGELEKLCAEIRTMIIDTVSKNGGHLASNLGIVELVVALHRVYDTAVDRLIFDVGHQCYAHKIITGRRDNFSTLRQYNGISGFPKPYESNDDAFTAGHASDSISVAYGMAKARTLLKDDYNIVCVIGDGAMTGGLAFEGMENIASSREPVVVVLNDNYMSIDRNVGGLANMLQAMRVKHTYIRFKTLYRELFSKSPNLYSFNHRLKENLKERILPSNIFSEMGFNYLGPVDGHDIDALTDALSLAKNSKDPVLLHVVTKKGRGYEFAEKNPELYHGISAFNTYEGVKKTKGNDFSAVFGDELTKIAQKDNSVVAVTAAMTCGTGLSGFSDKYPERFFDVGITEEHAAVMCGGMAKQGLKPVFAVYSTFLQRSYDAIIENICLQQLHTVFAIDRAGIVGNDGETHQGIYDVPMLLTIPGIKIYCPASYEELRCMLNKAVLEDTGPVAVRYPRGKEGLYKECFPEKEKVLNEGKDITIVSYGISINRVIPAVERLIEEGYSPCLIKISLLENSCCKLLEESVKITGKLLVIEDSSSDGCFGMRLLASLSADEKGLKDALLLNFGSGFVPHGSCDELYKAYGMDEDGIYKAALAMLNNTEN